MASSLQAAYAALRSNTRSSSTGCVPRRFFSALPTHTIYKTVGNDSSMSFFAGSFRNATHSSRTLRASSRSPLSRPNGPFRPQGPEGAWEAFKRRLNSLPSQAIVWSILGLNGVVFVMWNSAHVKYKSIGDKSDILTMIRNFTVSAHNLSSGRIWTLLTACFSHENASHIFVNAFTFYFMAPAVLEMLGNARFLAFYMGAGIMASVVSLYWHNVARKTRENYQSHGASGAIYAIISFFACVAPQQLILLFGIVPLPSWAFVTGIFLWDGFSALSDRSGTTDAAGHIGGILSGMLYYRYLRRRVL